MADLLKLRRARQYLRSPVLVGYYRRRARQVMALHRLLNCGIIGTVNGVCCKLVVRKASTYFHGWKVSRESGGGCLMINAIHDIDTLQYLLGPIAAVTAMQSTSDNPGNVEHLLVLNLRFRHGPLGVALFSDENASPYSYDNTVAAVTKFPRYPVDSLHLFGSHGSLAFPSFTLHRQRNPDGGWTDELELQNVSDANDAVDDPLIGQMQHFSAVIQGTEAPAATLDDALRNLAVVQAIRRSLASSATEAVELV
jgi:hypothetical protein